MYTPPTCRTSPSATSSPASAFGPWHFAAPAGQMTDLFGLVPAPANLSARQAKELGLLTSGTYGRHSTTSSASAALQSSLESRLRVKTSSLGSTLYKMTWKAWDTGSGRSRSRLRASVLRISATGSTGPAPWPTPLASNLNGGLVARALREDGRNRGPGLHDTAMLTGWTTPTTRDWKDSGGGYQAARRQREGSIRPAAAPSELGGLANTQLQSGCAEHELEPGRRAEGPADIAELGSHGQECGPSPTNGFWRDADWLGCRDGKWRPVEPGTFPLAHGAAARVGRLRAYGNAINAEAARVFIEAVMETAP
jgi:hypothetical protein